MLCTRLPSTQAPLDSSYCLILHLHRPAHPHKYQPDTYTTSTTDWGNSNETPTWTLQCHHMPGLSNVIIYHHGPPCCCCVLGPPNCCTQPAECSNTCGCAHACAHGHVELFLRRASAFSRACPELPINEWRRRTACGGVLIRRSAVRWSQGGVLCGAQREECRAVPEMRGEAWDGGGV